MPGEVIPITRGHQILHKQPLHRYVPDDPSDIQQHHGTTNLILLTHYLLSPGIHEYYSCHMLNERPRKLQSTNHSQIGSTSVLHPSVELTVGNVSTLFWTGHNDKKGRFNRCIFYLYVSSVHNNKITTTHIGGFYAIA